MGLPREDSTLGTSSNLQPCDSGERRRRKRLLVSRKLMTPWLEEEAPVWFYFYRLLLDYRAAAWWRKYPWQKEKREKNSDYLWLVNCEHNQWMMEVADGRWALMGFTSIPPSSTKTWIRDGMPSTFLGLEVQSWTSFCCRQELLPYFPKEMDVRFKYN